MINLSNGVKSERELETSKPEILSSNFHYAGCFTTSGCSLVLPGSKNEKSGIRTHEVSHCGFK